MGSIPELGRSPGGGNGNTLSILAWKIPWTEEPSGLQSIGLQRVGHDRATEHILAPLMYNTVLASGVLKSGPVMHITMLILF